MFDAYTVKKVLPRLVAAIVLIQLSWFIFTTLIQLTNMVAYGLEALLAAPFGGIQNLDLVSTLNTAGIDGPAFTFVFAAGLGVAGFVVGSLAIFVMIALLVGFIVLAIRRVILVALLVLAPLALVAWILPGTQRFWKLYWENFTKLLIMFPLILLMITAGKILAQVIALQMGSDQGLAQPLGLVLILVCFFAPFFLIPQTYKAAGAGLAFAAGWVGGQANRGEGFLQKQRGDRRGKRWQSRGERAKTDNLFRGGNQDNLRGKLNRAVGTATVLGAGGLAVSPNKRRARMQTARGSRNFDAASQFMKENAAFSALSSDDDKLWAIMQGGSEEQVRQNLANRAPSRFSDPAQLEAAVSEVMRARREGGDEIARIAATRAQAGTGTGFASSGQMLDSINAAAGGDRSVAGRMLGEMRGAATQSGRVDLGGAGFADMAQAMDKRRSAQAGGPAYSEAEATHDLNAKVMKAHGGGALLSGKKQAVEALAPQMLETLDGAMKSGDVTRVNRELAAIAGRYDAMGQVAPQNAEVMADKVLGAVAYFDSNGRGVTVQSMIEAQRSNPEFLHMRREYGTASASAAAAAAAAAAGGGGAPAGGGGGGGAPGP